MLLARRLASRAHHRIQEVANVKDGVRGFAFTIGILHRHSVHIFEAEHGTLHVFVPCQKFPLTFRISVGYTLI